MKLSVIIPAYNEEKYIEKCLLSLKKQTEKPDEIIVVDNNSTDNTAIVAKKHNIKVIKEKKQGMISARNCGFNNAKYEIIARCDADTILPSNWIKKIKANFIKNKIDALSGPIIFFDLPLKSPLYAKVYADIMKLIHNGNSILSGPNMALRKSIWKKVRNKVCLNDKTVHEDIDLSIHIIREGGKIKYDKSLVIKHSGRRIKNEPHSFFIEYPLRAIRTLRNHK